VITMLFVPHQFVTHQCARVLAALAQNGGDPRGFGAAHHQGRAPHPDRRGTGRSPRGGLVAVI